MKETEPPKQNDAIGALVTAMSNASKANIDTRNQAYKDIIGYLVNKEKLLMFSRLDEDDIINVIKNRIFVNLYQRYYMSLITKINFNIVKRMIPCICSNPKNCKICKGLGQVQTQEYNIKADDKGGLYDKDNNFKDAYENIIDDYLTARIALKGQGRDEMLSLLKVTDESLTLMEKAKQAIRGIV